MVILDAELDRHPAYLAWRLASSGRVRPPSSIEILKPEKRKSAVYRLRGAGSSSASLVVKRRPCGELAEEVRLYDELLPTLPLGSLEIYGCVEEYDGFGWLFLEDAGEIAYSRDVPEHQALAVEWLGRLHSCAAPGPSWLTDTGPTYFRSILDLAQLSVQTSLGHTALSPSDKDVLDAILVSLANVDNQWQRIQESCARMPLTVVHGDFVPKNVRVRERRGRLDIVAFDWETAGIATPAVDIATLHGSDHDRKGYLSIVNEVWPHLRPNDVEEMAVVGDLFRLLHTIYWEGRSFRYEWIQRAVRNMAFYERALADTTRTLGWAA